MPRGVAGAYGTTQVAADASLQWHPAQAGTQSWSDYVGGPFAAPAYSLPDLDLPPAQGAALPDGPAPASRRSDDGARLEKQRLKNRLAMRRKLLI